MEVIILKKIILEKQKEILDELLELNQDMKRIHSMSAIIPNSLLYGLKDNEYVCVYMVNEYTMLDRGLTPNNIKLIAILDIDNKCMVTTDSSLCDLEIVKTKSYNELRNKIISECIDAFIDVSVNNFEQKLPALTSSMGKEVEIIKGNIKSWKIEYNSFLHLIHNKKLSMNEITYYKKMLVDEINKVDVIGKCEINLYESLKYSMDDNLKNEFILKIDEILKYILPKIEIRVLSKIKESKTIANLDDELKIIKTIQNSVKANKSKNIYSYAYIKIKNKIVKKQIINYRKFPILSSDFNIESDVAPIQIACKVWGRHDYKKYDFVNVIKIISNDEIIYEVN